MHIFDFIYATDENLTINSLLELPEAKPFKPNNIPGFISWLFVELSKMDISRQTQAQFKQTIFVKICDLLQQNIDSLDPNESANILYHLSIMLTSDLQNVEMPLDEIQALFDNVHLNLNTVDSSQTISFTLWAMISLFEKRNLIGVGTPTIEMFLSRWDLICRKNPNPENISMALNGITMLYASGYLSMNNPKLILLYFNAFYEKRHDASSKHIASYFSSINKLIRARKLDGVNANQVKDLFDEFNKKNEDAESQDIIIVLSAFAAFKEKIPNLNIDYIKPNLDNLLFRVVEKIDQTDGNNVADLLNAIASLVEHVNINQIRPELITAILDQWFQHCGHDQECIANGLISIGKLIKNQILDCNVEDIFELYIRLYSNPYLTPETSTACLWSMDQLILSKKYPTLKSINRLSIALAENPDSEFKQKTVETLARLRALTLPSTLIEIGTKAKIRPVLNQSATDIIRNIVNRLSDKSVKDINKAEVLEELCTIIPDILRSQPVQIKDSSYILNKIVLLLSYDLKNLKLPNLPFILDDLFTILQMNDHDYQSKQIILWSLTKLAEAKQLDLDAKYIVLIHKIINELYAALGFNQLNIGILASSIQSITKLIDLKSLTDINLVKIERMLNACYEKLDASSKFSDIVNVLWSTEKLKTIEIPQNKIINLLQYTLALHKTATPHEILSVFIALAKMAEMERLPIQLDLLPPLFETFFRPIKLDPGLMANIMWSISVLTEKGNLTSRQHALSLICKLFDDFINYPILYPEFIIKGLLSITKLVELGITFRIDSKKIENLIKKFIASEKCDAKEIAEMKSIVKSLIDNHLITINETTQQFYTYIYRKEGVITENIKFMLSDLENNNRSENDKQHILQNIYNQCEIIVSPTEIKNVLISIASLHSSGVFEATSLDTTEIRNMLFRFYSQVKTSSNISTADIASCIWSLGQIPDLNLKIHDIKNIEFLIHVINSRNNICQEDLQKVYYSIQKFFGAETLHTSNAIKDFIRYYIGPEIKAEAKQDEDKLDIIKLKRSSLDEFVLETAQTIKFLTDGKEVFLGGSGAADAALPWKKHKSDYDIRLFDLTEADINNLYNHFKKIAPDTCKKIDGDHPKIQFELEKDGKTYLFQIATSWTKNLGETDDAAMFRKVNTRGVNLESLYVPLTQDSPELELKGSHYDISTFKQNRISVRDKDYFKNDAQRVLRLVKKELDYHHPDAELNFKSDEQVSTLLSDKKLKNVIGDYLRIPANIKRFSNTLQSILRDHALYDVVRKMNNVGVINAIINFPKLTFDDLEHTVRQLKKYDKSPCSPESKQIGLGYYLLAHVCRQIKNLQPEEQKLLLDNWQLKNLIWSLPNPEYPIYQDFITRTWLTNYHTDTELLVVTRKPFLKMLKKIDAYYNSIEGRDNIPNYAGTRNPLFAANMQAPQTRTNVQGQYNPNRHTR